MVFGLAYKFMLDFLTTEGICAQHECLSSSQLKELAPGNSRNYTANKAPLHRSFVLSVMQSIQIKLQVLLFPFNFKLLRFHMFS